MSESNNHPSKLSISRDCTDLVIVCCHATYIGGDLGGDPLNEKNWILQPFQRADPATHKASEARTFAAHYRAGEELCKQNAQALLLVSGGRTTNRHYTEGQSYHNAFSSITLNLLSEYVESLATDSYQNLLFSVLHFRHLVGRYPEYVTVITHAFKANRFLMLHARAIKWPQDRIRVQGVDPPFTLAERAQTEQLERQRAFEPFEADLYGVRAPLADKRRARNWEPRALDSMPTYDESVWQLLRWTGGLSGNEIFPGRLPWEEEGEQE
ncbi:hypothetical protein BAUCODRAFT_126433 [Baudoinia panamericana UAMH 10762]|uniref:Uncharacterized protein n=1 Tax=Baudoinia panamericana (strain UAMH 10762) TaxID=717646 RepID=M2LEM9_BAUPA|nr:uncharacterized protein BAUCODRAFT_126433 [Baudoinia panamericana UAMH 10762]EMC92452.1 hypothetical protein BAUCODRAFT_126433 [Baudoinia panamericana UAMH 10762]